jgi:dTDP-4-amino-4,6-dideoxygalactose transaminase
MNGYATNNAHMFYVVFPDLDTRTKLIDHLKANGIYAAFHYLSLHTSPYYHERHDGRVLPNTDRFADCLLRLPMFYELTEAQVDFITQTILQFFGKYE